MTTAPVSPSVSEDLHRNPLHPFMDGENGILHLVILPRVKNLFTLHSSEIDSEAALHKLFREKTKSCVSPAQFGKWLVALGISFKPTVAVYGLPTDPAE